MPLGAAGSLDMSDLVVADRITTVGEPVARDSFRIEANPAMRFAARDTVALYWET